MDKMYVGVIYAAKANRRYNHFKSIADFMSDYTGTPVECYTPVTIKRIVVKAFGQLLNEIKNPGALFESYMRWKEYPWDLNDLEAMCAALSEVQVREPINSEKTQYKYINGFCEVEGFTDD